jgi:hypothetical protein
VVVESAVAAPDPALMVVDALQFGVEFDGLRAAPGLELGDPLTGEEPVADDADDACDLRQLTTTGMAYWRCSSATANFVANDGLHHWALLDGQFVEWVAPTIDPPLGAMPAELLPLVNLVCLGPNESQQDACIVADGTTTEGFIEDPGASSVYAFQVDVPLTQVHVDLTDLPADYDLYLIDGSGKLLAQSVQEDTQPEAIDAPLTSGAYLLYVHSDPGRAVDPENPFVLHLDMRLFATDTADQPVP